MKTLILQSYRTEQVPCWIHTSLESVKSWAQDRQYDYRFLGDEFFDRVPGWVRQRFGMHLFPQTDLARLYLLKEGLDEGYQRVAWLDADVLVFDAERFSLETKGSFAFCREYMLIKLQDGRIQSSQPSVNNAVMVFKQGQIILDFYLFAAEQHLKHIDPTRLQRTALGPDLLQRLSTVMPLELNLQVGLFTPALMEELALGQGQMAAAYAQHQAGVPLAAANLCHFRRHYMDEEKKLQMDKFYELAVAGLLESRGGVINKYCRI